MLIHKCLLMTSYDFMTSFICKSSSPILCRVHTFPSLYIYIPFSFLFYRTRFPHNLNFSSIFFFLIQLKDVLKNIENSSKLSIETCKGIFFGVKRTKNKKFRKQSKAWESSQMDLPSCGLGGDEQSRFKEWRAKSY